MTSGAQHITSRDNALLKELRRLAQDNQAYRRVGRIWVEGDHLCRAALARGVVPLQAVFALSAWREQGLALPAETRVVTMDDTLFASLSGLESPAPMGFVVALPELPAIEPDAATVILDRVQDAGNVGSILRSAGAFGFRQIVALKGTAALWSAKVLRSGMGAHFGLRLIEGASCDDLKALRVPILATSSHAGRWLHETQFTGACAWALGHEGQGIGPELVALAADSVRIAQPGGEESLNVAAAAAICLHASMPFRSASA
jgi:TrmH family RNA methyltransferase